MTREYPVSDDPERSWRVRWSLPTILILCLFVGSFVSSCTGAGDTKAELSGTIRVDGSTALQPLVEQAAIAFEKLNPLVHITVSGGGSFTGLNDVYNRKTHIGDSDVYASFAAYPNPDMTDHIVCVTPFSLIANLDVPVPSLTREQIVDIFSTNEITNWKEVGGPDLPIVPIVRPATSGTRDTFRKYVLSGRDEGSGNQVLQKDSNTEVHDKVAQTPGAIGYLVQALIDNKVRPLAIEGKNATKENIIGGNYTFWSYEHMYTLGDGNPIVSAFLDFMISSTVRELALKNNYIPIRDMRLPQVSSTKYAYGIPSSTIAWYPIGKREVD